MELSYKERAQHSINSSPKMKALEAFLLCDIGRKHSSGKVAEVFGVTRTQVIQIMDYVAYLHDLADCHGNNCEPFWFERC